MSYFIRYVHFSQDSWVMMVSGCHIDTKLRFKHLRERFTQKKTEPRSKKTAIPADVCVVQLPPPLVDDLIDRGLLVPRPRHDVLVIGRDVAAEDGGRLLGLQEGKKTAMSEVWKDRPQAGAAGCGVGSVPGRCWRRRGSSTRSAGCLCPCSRTIYLQTDVRLAWLA